MRSSWIEPKLRGRSPMPMSSTSVFKTQVGTVRAGRWPTAVFRSAATAELEASPDVALAWTLRAAPHYYRRADLPEVLIATSPLSDRDAAKRVIGADKPLKEAGIPTLTGLTEVATQLRQVVTRPMAKGEVSTRLTKRLDAPYLRYCGSCQATHSWEVPFRVGTLYAGLELEPGTSPPSAASHRELAETQTRACPGPDGCSSVPATDPQLPPVSRTRHTKRCGRLPRLARRRDQEALAGRCTRSQCRWPAGLGAGRDRRDRP